MNLGDKLLFIVLS